MIQLNINKKSCENFNFNGTVCCEKCNCNFYSCETDEKMSCHKATVAEALTYFFDNMTSSVTDTFYNLLTSSMFSK